MKIMRIIGEALLYIFLFVVLFPWIIAFGIRWIFGEREGEDNANGKNKDR